MLGQDTSQIASNPPAALLFEAILVTATMRSRLSQGGQGSRACNEGRTASKRSPHSTHQAERARRAAHAALERAQLISPNLAK